MKEWFSLATAITAADLHPWVQFHGWHAENAIEVMQKLGWISLVHGCDFSLRCLTPCNWHTTAALSPSMRESLAFYALILRTLMINLDITGLLNIKISEKGASKKHC